ncbi:hypothetical protein LRP88_04907 [Fusarium phalaenopsidis]
MPASWKLSFLALPFLTPLSAVADDPGTIHTLRFLEFRVRPPPHVNGLIAGLMALRVQTTLQSTPHPLLPSFLVAQRKLRERNQQIQLRMRQEPRPAQLSTPLLPPGSPLLSPTTQMMPEKGLTVQQRPLE